MKTSDCVREKSHHKEVVSFEARYKEQSLESYILKVICYDVKKKKKKEAPTTQATKASLSEEQSSSTLLLEHTATLLTRWHTMPPAVLQLYPCILERF